MIYFSRTPAKSRSGRGSGLAIAPLKRQDDAGRKPQRGVDTAPDEIGHRGSLPRAKCSMNDRPDGVASRRVAVSSVTQSFPRKRESSYARRIYDYDKVFLMDSRLRGNDDVPEGDSRSADETTTNSLHHRSRRASSKLRQATAFGIRRTHAGPGNDQARPRRRARRKGAQH